MDINYIESMIERFFDASLSIEEERELCRYLRENDVPDELRKEKEALLALCDDEISVEIPEGFEDRLETMIDSLEKEVKHQAVAEKRTERNTSVLLRVPRFVWRSAAAVAVFAIGYIFMSESWELTENDDTIPVVVAEQPEKDTFDNPEDAMKCFKAAFGDIKIAMNATLQNARGIGNVIELSSASNRNEFKKNI